MTRFGRFVPLTGLTFVALAVAGGLTIGNTPDTDATAAKVHTFYSLHHDRVFAAGVLFGYAAIFLAFFGATLWSRVRVLARPVLSAGVLVGAAVLASGLAVWGATYFALGDVGHKATVSANTLQTLHVLSQDVFLPVLAGIEILLWAVGLAGILGRILPAWLGWVALVLAILQITPIGFFATLAFLIWTIIVSILLLVRPAAPVPAGATA